MEIKRKKMRSEQRSPNCYILAYHLWPLVLSDTDTSTCVNARGRQRANTRHSLLAFSRPELDSFHLFQRIGHREAVENAEKAAALQTKMAYDFSPTESSTS